MGYLCPTHPSYTARLLKEKQVLFREPGVTGLASPWGLRVRRQSPTNFPRDKLMIKTTDALCLVPTG